MTRTDPNQTQVPTKLVSVEEVLRSDFFLWGVDDARSGHPPAFDCGVAPPSDWPAERSLILEHVGASTQDIQIYEIGRQFAVLMPPTVSIRTRDGRLRKRAIKLFKQAVACKDII
jgi:hypothetical protein